MKLINKIQQVGLAKTIDDSLSNIFSYSEYLWKRINNKPYFGSYLFSKQGNAMRHYYIGKLIEQYSNQYVNKEIRVLEIGSWAGGSAITICKALEKSSINGKLYCVDNWTPFFNKSNIDLKKWTYKTMHKAAKKNKIFNLFLYNIKSAKVNEMVHLLKGFSKDILPYLRSESLDFIFIDGSHSYENVLYDLESAKELLKEDGIICGDDLELQYFEINCSNIENIKSTDLSFDDKNNKRYHPGVTLAVHTFFNKEVSVWEGLWAMQKKNDSWEKIKLSLNDEQPMIPNHLK
jgi:hypothetical protein